MNRARMVKRLADLRCAENCAIVDKVSVSVRLVFGLLLAAASVVGATKAKSQAPTAITSDDIGGDGEMAKPPIAWTLIYNSDLNGDLSGGDRTGATYLQRVGLISDVSLADAVGWKGAKAHLSIHAINGKGLSEHFVGNILTVSNIEAEPALRLFNLWIEQDFGGGASLRVGQFTAAQEFMISSTAALFINSTFGWPGSFATDLPSGGPAYPLAAPGVHLAVKPTESTTARIAVFPGDPAGPGSGDPQRRDVHGFNSFKLHGAPYVIGEVSRDLGGKIPTMLLLGGWIHFGRFKDVQSVAGSEWSSGPAGPRQSHKGDFAVYGVVDAQLTSSGRRSLHAFFRGSASPSDRNPIDLYFDTGLSLQAPFPARPHDNVGLAFALARISPPLQRAERSIPEVTNNDVPPYEAAIELSYQFKLSSRAYLQPSLQWIINPAADVLARDPSSFWPNRHALVAGLRTSATF